MPNNQSNMTGTYHLQKLIMKQDENNTFQAKQNKTKKYQVTFV